eukprot:14519313-Alexandrium_andersonii.AAC.1
MVGFPPVRRTPPPALQCNPWALPPHACVRGVARRAAVLVVGRRVHHKRPRSWVWHPRACSA